MKTNVNDNLLRTKWSKHFRSYSFLFYMPTLAAEKWQHGAPQRAWEETTVTVLQWREGGAIKKVSLCYENCKHRNDFRMTLDINYISELSVFPNGHYRGQVRPVLATISLALFSLEESTSSGGTAEMYENLNQDCRFGNIGYPKYSQFRRGNNHQTAKCYKVCRWMENSLYGTILLGSYFTWNDIQ
jgi:hypothetical protein